MRRLRSIPGLLSTSAPAGSREAEHGAAALAEEVVDQEPGEEPDRAPGEPRVDVTLSNAERERLRTETDDWALERGRHGRRPAADEVSAEYERRVRAAEDLLGEMRAGLQEQYERGLRELERQREIEERERRLRESEERAQMLSIVPPAPEAGPLPNVTRRGLLTLAGLVGVQVAAAFGAAKLETRDAEATADATATAWSSGAAPGTPAPVIAAGGSNPVDGSDDPDAAAIDHVRLASLNGGRSLYSVFPGATLNPWPNHLNRLFPPPPAPAQAGAVRAFTVGIQHKVLEVANGVKWSGWTFDGTIPGPIIRVTEGDRVRVTLENGGDHPHSIHFHSIHPANQDGVFQAIPAGGRGTYEFTAEPFGVYPYHCHIDPIDQHTARGLYGTLIIDPPTPRPAAKEMVMVMNGYDLNFDKANELYSINGLPGYYHENPIDLKLNELVRVYLVNMTEFDAVNSFHLHANMFRYIPLGTSLVPSVLTDVVHLGVADRGILEFSYKYPGQYMFHAHQNELTIHGWKAMFNVK